MSWPVCVHEPGHLVAAVLAGAEPVSVSAASPEAARVLCLFPRGAPRVDVAAFAVVGLVSEEIVLGLPARFDPACPPGHDGAELAAEVARGVDPAAAVARARQLFAGGGIDLAAVAASLAASPRLGPWGITNVIEAASGGAGPAIR